MNMSADHIHLFVTFFLSFFVIINPFGNISIFLSITQNEGKIKRRKIIKRACVVAFFVLLAFLLFGEYILQLFHITVSSFKIAGGIILFTIAIRMLRARRLLIKSSPEEEEEAMEKDDVSITPLAIPMLSGPGAITTALSLSDNVSGILKTIILIFALFVSCLVTYVILNRSIYLQKYLKKTGLNIMTRIMGLLLTVIAVQFIVNGLADALPQILRYVK